MPSPAAKQQSPISTPSPISCGTHDADGNVDGDLGSPLTPGDGDEKNHKIWTTSLTAAIANILTHLRASQRHGGASEADAGSWQEFPLSKREYKQLVKEVSRGSLCHFWEGKLRYTYLPDSSTFVIRMPSALHETLVKLVVNEINTQLATLASTSANPETTEYINSILDCRSTRISLPDSAHDPDGSWRHVRARRPGVVLEVAYSQRKKNLGYLADEYIVESHGNIRAVVGLDVEYLSKRHARDGHRGQRKATLSVWRPAFQDSLEKGGQELICSPEIVDQDIHFVTTGPTGPSSANLVLNLTDFAPRALQPSSLPQGSISITAAQLSTFLAEAEEAQLAEDGVEDVLPAGVRKRKRARTPQEIVEEEREAAFRADEARAWGREKREDKTWTS